MAAGSSASDILAGAKAGLKKADDFTKSVEGKVPGRYAPPKHEYSDTPYTLAKKETPAPAYKEPEGGESAAKGVAEKAKNIQEYNKVYPNN